MVAGFSPTGAELADFRGGGRRIEGTGQARPSEANPPQRWKTRIRWTTAPNAPLAALTLRLPLG
jgi:hypothetical protein